MRQEEPGDAVAAIERKVRKYLVPWGLAWNPNVAVMQLTAIFPAMGDLGVKPMLKSLAYMASHGMEAAREIWKASPYMLSRMENMDQDLSRNVGQFSLERKKTFTIGKKSFTWDAIVDAGMKMIVGMDAAATCAVWLAAYKSRLEEMRKKPGLLDANTKAGNPGNPGQSPDGPGPEVQHQDPQDQSPNAREDNRPEPAPNSAQNPQKGGGLAAPENSPQAPAPRNAQDPAFAETGAPDPLQTSAHNPAREDAAGPRYGFSLHSRAGNSNQNQPENAQAQTEANTLGAAINGDADNASITPDNAPNNAPDSVSGIAANAQNTAPDTAPDIAKTGTGDNRSNAGRHWLDRINPLALATPVTERLYRHASNGSIIEFEDKCHLEASRYADMVVKQSNPDFDPSSRSAFLRGNGMARILNQFSSAIALFASRDLFLGTARDKGRISRVEYGKHQFYTYVLPALALSMFFWLLRDHDDRKGSALKSLAGYSIDQFSMKLPVFGSVAGAAMEQFAGLGTGRGGGLRTSLDAPFALGMSAARAAGAPLRDNKKRNEQKKEAIYAIADILSFIARVPVSKVARKAERGWEQRKRGEGNLTNLIFPKPGK